jgi:ATP-binding cassette, subfamily G (WHITE), member 2
MQYRMTRDFQDVHFLGPRIIDKLVLALIITSLYYNVGRNPSDANISNLTALLFLWAIMPGYTSASYVPTIVLERALYCRYVCCCQT